MSVTVNFTFEKKHFLMMGLIIAIPFLILAISNIIATTPTPTGQYHSASELWVNQDIEMNNFNLNNSGNISITGSENGIIFPDGSIQTSAITSENNSIPSTAIWMSKTFSFNINSHDSKNIGSITVGPRGGYLGTFGGLVGVVECSGTIMKYYINGVQFNPSSRMEIPLNSGDIINVKKCYTNACVNGGGSCMSTANSVNFGFWEY